MVKQVLSGQEFNEDDIVEYGLEQISSKYVANRLEFNIEIFYATKPNDTTLLLVDDYYKLIEQMGYGSTFYKVGKQCKK